MAEQLPQDVHRFIIEHINSVEQLEALLLLRSQPTKEWDAEAMGQALYTPPAAAAMRLEDLNARGFLEVTEASRKCYRYRAATPELDALLKSLAELYKERRVTVISLIYSKPQQQVQAFADAFKLRKET